MATKKEPGTSLTVPPPTKAEAAMVVNTTDLMQQVERCKILSDEDAEKATSLGSLIADLHNKAEAERKELTSPLNAVIKRINERYKTNLTGPLEAAKELIKAKLGDWMRAQRRLAEEQAAKLLAQQEKAEARGATTRATNLSVQAETALATAQVAGSTRGAVGGSAGLRKVWTWEVVDLAKVPRKFLVLDEAALRAELKRLREAARPESTEWTTAVAGIRFFEDEIVSLR